MLNFCQRLLTVDIAQCRERATAVNAIPAWSIPMARALISLLNLGIIERET